MLGGDQALAALMLARSSEKCVSLPRDYAIEPGRDGVSRDRSLINFTVDSRSPLIFSAVVFLRGTGPNLTGASLQTTPKMVLGRPTTCCQLQKRTVESLLVASYLCCDEA